MPFSTGPSLRQCIGQSLAHMTHDSIVARMVAHSTFELAPCMGGAAGVEARKTSRLTLQLGGSLWMRITLR
ncbi:hypothetical protein WJX75_009311 [Coccomyxa subellipsoidea]|uniref:Cytochrome P450 n=1 Tax=Coccomyxa subellipsoidea TaxID=248742 RepID=A0ABR2YNC0_9CHLO